jgi:mycofactocin precursor
LVESAGQDGKTLENLLYVLIATYQSVVEGVKVRRRLARQPSRSACRRPAKSVSVGQSHQVHEEVLEVRDTTTDAKAPMPATESRQDDFLIDEIEVEDLAIDGICGGY